MAVSTEHQSEQSITVENVREALRNWFDLQELGENPLAALRVVEETRLRVNGQKNPRGYGLALKELFAEILASLAADDKAPENNQLAAFQQLLTLQFVEGFSPEYVQDVMNIRRSGYFERQRKALSFFADRLFEREESCRDTIREILPALESAPDVADFIGRTAQLERLQARMRKAHFCVIVGEPGVGKTYLAAQLSRQLFPPAQVLWHKCVNHDGVDSLLWKIAVFLANQGHGELWQVLYANVQQMNLQKVQPTTVYIDHAMKYLARLQPLICLDNYEVLDHATEVNELVERLCEEAAHGRLYLLLTSQRRPPFRHIPEDPLPGFSLDETEAFLQQRALQLTSSQIAQLQQDLQGNALMLTLAVEALQRTDHVERLLQHLHEQVDLQQYLLHAVDRRLAPEERLVMQGVAVLGTDGGSRAAIQQLFAAGTVGQILLALQSRNLLRIHLTDEGSQYSQHPILQAYFYNDIVPHERNAMHRRSATYYEQQRGWLKAIEHYIAAEQYEQAATLAVRDPWHLINRGQLQQLQQLISALVQKALPSLLMAEVEITLALTAAYQQATVEAEGHYDQALQYLATEENSDLVRELRAKVYRHKVAYLHRYTSSDVALPLIKLGLDEVQGINSREEIELLLQRCILLRPQLQFSEAQRLFEECLAQIKPQEKRLRILALMGLSNVHFHAGEIQQGYALAVEASEIAEQVTDLANLIELRSNIANVEHQWGNWDRALMLYRDVVEQATQIGYIREKYRAELNLANLLLKRGNTGEAKDLLTGIINYTRQEGLYKLLIPALGQWGKLALQQNNLPEVAHAVTEALTLATAKTLTYMLPFLYGLQASYYLALSNFSEATASANQAMQQAQGMQMRIEEGISAVLLAQIAVKQAAYETAISWLERGSALLQDDPYELAHAYLLWQQIPTEVIPDSVPHNELLIQAQALMQQLGIDYP